MKTTNEQEQKKYEAYKQRLKDLNYTIKAGNEVKIKKQR